LQKTNPRQKIGRMAAIWRKSNFHLIKRNPYFQNSFRTSYYVLPPEIPPDTPETNPILRTKEQLDYKTVGPELCQTAVAKLALEHESGIWKLEKTISEPGSNVTFKSLMDPLEKLGAPLDAAWGVSRTLYVTDLKVMPAEVYKSIHNRAHKARSMKFQSKPIYEACKRILKEDGNMNQFEKRLLTKFVLEGRLNGSELNEVGMKNYIATSRKLEEQKSNFQMKVEKATNSFIHLIENPDEVKDFPSELLRATALNSLAPSRGPWKISLAPHIYSSFMQYCPDSLLRWNVWKAHRSRGSPGQNKDVTTSLHLEEIRFARRDQVKLLGYSSFADMSMETKMAGSINTVKNMIESLAEKVYPLHVKEIEDLQAFAHTKGFQGNLELWDVDYWRRKQKVALFKYEEGEVREYFPLPRVMDGLYSMIDDVFGIKFELVDSDKSWHPDVNLYAVRNQDGSLIGHFYFDPYSRIGEKLLSREASSWMIGMRSRSDIVGHTPNAAVVLNFTPPRHGIPSLLSFTEIRTLFSKMGHALQHLITKSPYSEVAGLTNLEWDAVEISAQFFQCWLSDYGTVAKISGHFESGQPITENMFQQLDQAANHMSATDLNQQLYLASLDMELYSTKDFWLDVVKKLWPKFHPFALEKTDSHPCSFTDIVSGDWAAAYYSHTWSKMVATDIFSSFQEAGMNDPKALREVGERYRSVVLGNGGSCHPSETFRQFRGRDPSSHALLSNLGLVRD